MQFTVTPASLNNFATYCDQQVADIDQAVHQLANQIQELCSAPYVGPASAQLIVDMTAVSNETIKLHTAMHDITANLRHNAVVYGDGETQNITNLQGAEAAVSAGNAAA
jgi:uncharacterized protein YukE